MEDKAAAARRRRQERILSAKKSRLGMPTEPDINLVTRNTKATRKSEIDSTKSSEKSPILETPISELGSSSHSAGDSLLKDLFEKAKVSDFEVIENQVFGFYQRSFNLSGLMSELVHYCFLILIFFLSINNLKINESNPDSPRSFSDIFSFFKNGSSFEISSLDFNINPLTYIMLIEAGKAVIKAYYSPKQNMTANVISMTSQTISQSIQDVSFIMLSSHYFDSKIYNYKK
ncbi:hypothetical protein BB560_002206 [Smittium megazygosporum]|uniref:Uncharacterized protein n=1 Tax=Smittium megazygosporum TaxID=133381 RepID=A0A2T9ZFH5_9FUNG|nr:hypothetical protein BB560_002206 [Smittium megazygosporum]